MKNNLCTDFGYVSLNKYGEELCGDRVELYSDDHQSLIVLADGLGSGVKANILSTLTSKIICTMLSGGMSVEDCITTIASTLPVCSVRGVAYSTFAVVRILDNEIAELIQFDNPPIIVLRHGKSLDYPCTKREIGGKEIRESRFPVKSGDLFVLMSDGAPYAGVGQAFNFGWQHENIVRYLEDHYDARMAAKSVAGLVTDECDRLYCGEPGDDTTIGVMRVRPRKTVNLMIGPPADKSMDAEVLSSFFNLEGDHIVCGGTTATLAAKYLDKPIETSLDYLDPKVPPICTIEGIDLTTEGVITLSHVYNNARDFISGEDTGSWALKRDGASLISRMLFIDATDICFYVGRAINPAHQNPDLPITFSIKLQLIENLKDSLEKMGKRITIHYY